MQGKGFNSQAFSRYKHKVNEVRAKDRGRSHNFKDVWDDTIGRNVAVIFEQVSLGWSKSLEIRIEPSNVLITASDMKP